MQLPITFLLAAWLTTAQAGLGDLQGALDAPDRSAEDRARDAADHPAELLVFAGVTPGMRLLDLFAGGGYYSELLGTAVAPGGEVLLHNNAAYLGFAGDALQARIDRSRMPNVRPVEVEADDLALTDGSLDGVFMMIVFHDFWYTADGWEVTAEQVLPQLQRALKPGGFVLVVDHVANAGSGTSAAQDLHRIEPSAVVSTMQAHGFRLDSDSDLLANPNDDHTRSVFDPAIRGHTDRLVQRYTKR